METCDTIRCRLHPHADLRLHDGSTNRLHPTTTYGAGGLVLTSWGHMGCYRVCGGTYAWRRRHKNDRPSLGPS
eukprot:9487464-Pyramimonas_sp.AAC.1